MADIYADDPDHPIPYLDRLDVVAANRTGGARLVIVIAAPLRAESRSLERLMRKIENYLGFIVSDNYLSEFGAPDPSNTEIAVAIDGGSSPEAFELLERCKPWTLANSTTLIIEPRPQA